MSRPRIKAKITDKGELVIVTTELGQQAVVPKDRLCELALRFNLEFENIEINCATTTSGGEEYIEFE
jgi:hypothetical protein